MRNLLLITFSVSLISAALTFSIDEMKHKFQDIRYGHKEEHTKQTTTQATNDDCKDYPSNHKVTSLPYWDTTQTLPCMYAGTFQSNQPDQKTHNLFYWFFRNTTLTNAPLVLWINGGPGSSSMFGLFLENGPLRVTQPNGGKDNDDFVIGLEKRGSWGDYADMIFLDQPVGTGFSYGESVLDDMNDGAQEFVNFLKAFFAEYTEYQNRPFYISGESYAGKYIPLFAKYVVDQKPTNLSGVLIGNPYASPLIQRTSTHKVAQSLGIIDTYNMDQIATLRRQCEETLSTTFSTAGETCTKTMDYVDEVGGDVFSYDARIFGYDWTPVETPYMAYLTSSNKVADLYKAIHIDKSTKVPVWESGSEAVGEGYAYDQMIDYTQYYDQLVKNGIPTLVYAGQWDSRDGPVTIEPWLKLMKTMYDTTLWTQDRKIYYYKDASGAQKVGGYYRYDAAKNFTFLTVAQAGHFVPTNRLEASKQFLQDMVTVQHLQCHGTDESSCKTSTIMCDYMKNCSGHGTCDQNNGQCTCNSGYKGADCSEKVEQLSNFYNKKFSLNGTQWTFFQFKQGLYLGQSFDFTLSSTQPLDIYILQGADSDPNEFNYDLAFKQQNYIKLSYNQFPFLSTFTAAVRANGIDYYSNKFYVSSIQAKFDVSSVSNDAATSNETVSLLSSAIQQETNEDQKSEPYLPLIEFLAILTVLIISFGLLFLKKSSSKQQSEQTPYQHIAVGV